MTKTWISAAAVVLTIGVAGAAHAQDETPDRTAGMYAQPTTEPTSYRPEGRSLGIGFGYSSVQMLNVGISDIGAPNTVSGRFRLGTGLAIEPVVGVSVDTTSTKPQGASADTTSDVRLFAGGNARKDLMKRSKVNVVGIVGANLSVLSGSDKTAGIKTTTTEFGIGANWGLGVEYWPKQHWSFSLDATNPALNLTSGTVKVGSAKTTTSGFFIGALWNPTVALMTHLYY